MQNLHEINNKFSNKLSKFGTLLESLHRIKTSLYEPAEEPMQDGEAELTKASAVGVVYWLNNNVDRLDYLLKDLEETVEKLTLITRNDLNEGDTIGSLPKSKN
jgi:hypothetical protein